MSDFKARILPASEWGRLEEAFQADTTVPVPDMTKMLAVEREGELVASLSSQWIIYLSHLWVREDLRGGLLAERLARKTIELYPKGTRALMLTESSHVERLAHRVGMMPQKGSGFLWKGDLNGEGR